MKIYYFPTINSTQEYVRSQFNNWQNQNAIVIANSQDNGIGQFGKKWLSNANAGWYFSLYLGSIKLPVSHYSSIHFNVCVEVHKLLQEKGLKELWIKWPNDIYTTKGKIAGILIDTTIENNTIKNILIGIGINNIPQIQNNSFFLNSTGLSHEGLENASIPLTEIINWHRRIASSFAAYQEDAKMAIAYYNKYLYGFGKSFTFDYLGKEIHGQVLGITDKGFLKLKTKTGIIEVATGSIIWKTSI